MPSAVTDPGERGDRGLRLAKTGLRARSALSFGVGALLVASVMAGLTFAISRTYLLRQRETSAMRQSFADARLIRDALAEPTIDVGELLTSLRPDELSEVGVQVGDRWFSTSVALTPDRIPPEVVRIAESGAAGRQRVTFNGIPTVAVGAGLPGVSAQYYELFPLRELGRTLTTLRVALSVSAAIAAIAGATVGLFASRRVLRPLRDVAAAATDITAGSLDLRLEGRGDPDLGPLTDAFNGMVQALQERISREARFSSDVSHELRTPLATISAAMSIARRRRDDLPPDLQQVVDLLDDQVDAFQSLTIDLLELARVDAGTATVHLEPIDPVAFAHQIRSSIETAEGIEIVVDDDVTELAPILLADKRRLRQVFVNLMGNAERYAGGVDRISITSPSSQVLRFLIDDRGPGVDEDEREAIFGRFSRGHAASLASESKGSGLGLALSRQHATLMGGSLWVEDRPGGGARFVLELPIESVGDA